MAIKTTIDIPDQIYNLAEDIAKKLGISRSQLYAEALEAYIINYIGQASPGEPTQDDIDLQTAFKRQFDSILKTENEPLVNLYYGIPSLTLKSSEY